MRKPGMPILTAKPMSNFEPVVTNEYMEDSFFIKIETWHKPDLGTQENVHKLDNATWEKVVVVPIDIADRSQVSDGDYKPDADPAKFKSVKTGRGPLGPTWKKELVNSTDCPRMCAYKLVTVKFKWWGLQSKVENFIHDQEKRIFNNFHRQLFCWIDKWVQLNMDDIRRMEAETQKELDEGTLEPSIPFDLHDHLWLTGLYGYVHFPFDNPPLSNKWLMKLQNHTLRFSSTT
ncbi:phosphatidylinositol transfer protein alpha isoform-like isoform X4 [Cynoglossus semilaevis]|uniref:phosphatidylinositol transfer protein alpha isoform-like isoform X4 n=1 Tax=Cynoglossus semilaevis TaxID=244447 RepID=UPI000D62EBCC|nr:phosphatidylinositol transfer protein alpha isoform-like isoform X4 [Cynoglossus semilaevis]